jgi:hypothetical protein
MPDLILSSGALLDYAREMKISPVSVEKYLGFQIAYSLAVLRETAIESAVRDRLHCWPEQPRIVDAATLVLRTQELSPVHETIQVTIANTKAEIPAVVESAKPETLKPPKKKRW